MVIGAGYRKKHKAVAGGITQHLGAYKCPQGSIERKCFVDTAMGSPYALGARS